MFLVILRSKILRHKNGMNSHPHGDGEVLEAAGRRGAQRGLVAQHGVAPQPVVVDGLRAAARLVRREHQRHHEEAARELGALPPTPPLSTSGLLTL